nr:IncI1 plasmid conjugative transfer pilus-tip adhesin protein PilVC [Escherichia coli]
MPTIILCKRANPVPGGAPKIQFTTQTYNIAKNTRNLRLGGPCILLMDLPEWLTLWWFSTGIFLTKTTFGM